MPKHIDIPAHEIAEMKRLYTEENKSLADLANLYPYSNPKIHMTLIDEGFELRPRWKGKPESRAKAIEMFKANHPIEEIVKVSGLSEGTIYNVLAKAGLREKRVMGDMSKLPWDQIIERYQAGEGLIKIAEDNGVSSPYLRSVLVDRGVIVKHEGTYKIRHTREGYLHVAAHAFERWRQRAIKRNVEWAMTPDHIESLYQRQKGLCYYTGVPMRWVNTNKDLRKTGNPPDMLSLDRVDSNLGYIPGNVVLCCVAINFAKNAYSREAFEAFLQRVVQVAIANEKIAETEDSLTL